MKGFLEKSRRYRKNFVDSFNQGEYKPEVLFDDHEIVERIKEHPMALWKMNEVE